jgi:outer membrane immunogenic protein
MYRALPAAAAGPDARNIGFRPEAALARHGAPAGWLYADRWLVYATGGAAFGEIKTDATVSVPGASTTSSFSQDQVGWAAGAGVEAALGGGWTGKVEYLHVDLGSFSYSYTSRTTFPFRGSFSATSHVTDDIVRVGLNYRLGGAVMSKY